MALDYASDKEKTLIERLKSNHDLVTLMRDAWSTATRNGEKRAYFQVTDQNVRYMFHLAYSEGNIKVSFIAQQDLFQK